MSDYDARAETFGFASKEQILATSKLPDTVFLDVRTPAEIAVAKLSPAGAGWVSCSCTPDEAPELETNASTLFPNKEAPIVIYCGTGRRACKAKAVLVAQGYTTVLNAGGLSDLGYLIM